jgi:hypothetical protein
MTLEEEEGNVPSPYGSRPRESCRGGTSSFSRVDNRTFARCDLPSAGEVWSRKPESDLHGALAQFGNERRAFLSRGADRVKNRAQTPASEPGDPERTISVLAT